jgi:acetyl esterase/lipase
VTRTLTRCVLAACACALVFASTASANTLAPTSISLPIQVPSMGNWVDGTSTLAVVYTDTQATATATTTPIGLAAGQLFRIRVCIKAHQIDTSASSVNTKCADSAVDTTSRTSALYLAAPSTTAVLSRPRPSTGNSAYFSYEVSVQQRQADGAFKEIASSWPSTGLAGASVSVPAAGATTAPAPASEGVMLSNKKTGGMHTGQPDSFCAPEQSDSVDASADGVTTTGLPSDAPAYYEIGEPTGAYAGQPPKGVMLIIHGGGWFMVGSAYVAYERSEADRWRARGWRTLNIDYRPCSSSFADVQWFYDQARQLWGTSVPYCALGGSAGGHLALLLAATRPSVACVVDEAGPTDGTTLPNQSTPKGHTDGPRWVYNLLTAAIGPEMVRWWSPALFKINARVLFATSADDPYIPFAQGTELRTNMLNKNPNAYVDTLQLAGGSTSWVHAGISADALTTFENHEEQLVAPLVG